jgi:protein FAM50
MTFYKGNSNEAVRAMQLQKRRAQQQEDIEIKKKKIEEDNKMTSIDNKFKVHHYDAVEQLLKTDTIGLVTLEDMKRKREAIIEQREQQLARERSAKLQEEIEKKQKKEIQKTHIQKLSFADDFFDEENDDEDNSGCKNKPNDTVEPKEETEVKDTPEDDLKLKKRFGKNPNVDTSFLPDKEREQKENDLR